MIFYQFYTCIFLEKDLKFQMYASSLGKVLARLTKTEEK